MKKYLMGILFSVACLSVGASFADDFSSYANYEYNPNDFATEIIEYIQGAGVGVDFITGKRFNDPNSALGRPTVDTNGDGWVLPEDTPCPVVPVCTAYRSYELVTIGNGGRLTVKFNRPVLNNENNPYGIDFIVFGNALHGTTTLWTYENPGDTYIYEYDIIAADPGIVSVSQDGEIWYTFTEGPFADDFAATLGRIYNPSDPDLNLGAWNLWWGRPTNPTLPLNPLLSLQGFGGISLADMCGIYGNSAGGTGFDIGLLELNWIQYVRIEDSDDPNNGLTEIDAISDVRGCDDCRINFKDFAELANRWSGSLPDMNDLKKISDNWLMWSWE